MDKDLLKGFKISLGFIIGLSLFLGVVYAVGFHQTSEIVPGVFQGDYTFNGSVDIKGDISLGGNSTTCDRNGKIRYSSSGNTMEFCNGEIWKKIPSTYPSSCQEILTSGDSNGSGIYTIDPDGPGGVKPFEVYCEMDENGGGWIKLTIGNVTGSSCNGQSKSDNAIYVDKYTYNGDFWNSTLSSNLDRNPENFCLDKGNIDSSASGLDYHQFYRKDVDYAMWSNFSHQYTEPQENAIRNHISKLSNTTRAFGHSHDDDYDTGGSCTNYNGEFRIYSGNGYYHYTKWQVKTNQQGLEFKNHKDLDVSYLMPSEFSGFNGCDSSGGSTSISFGYEKSYFLVK